MLIGALTLLAVASIGGILLGAIHVQGKKPWLAIALGHGALATGGLVLLYFAASSMQQAGMIYFSLAFFALALTIGVVMLFFRLFKKPVEMTLVALHGVFALLGFVCLLAGMMFMQTAP